MELSGALHYARVALASARAEQAAHVMDAVRGSHVVGVLGEAEVGKTATTRQALMRLDRETPVLRIDLRGVASDAHLASLIARQIARVVLGDVDYEMLVAGALVARRVDQGRLELADVLGVDGLDEVLREWPSGTYTLPSAFRALGALLARRELVLWVDHAEAPRLTPRHPLQLQRLLWGLRELVQRGPSLRVVISARAALEDDLIGSRAPFHQQGTWVRMAPPAPAAWVGIAEELAAGNPMPLDEVAVLARLAGGHPRTMLLALAHYRIAERWRRLSARALFDELALREGQSARRALDQARTLHRLGGQVLQQVARGERPYAAAQRGTASPQEIRKVLDRLRLAGLLSRNEGWTVTDPLLTLHLGAQDPSGPRTVYDA